jgi:hypothetical protein
LKVAIKRISTCDDQWRNILRYILSQVSRKGKSRAKEITEMRYVTVTIQENTLDGGLAGVYDKDRANECSDIPGDQYKTINLAWASLALFYNALHHQILPHHFIKLFIRHVPFKNMPIRKDANIALIY